MLSIVLTSLLLQVPPAPPAPAAPAAPQATPAPKAAPAPRAVPAPPTPPPGFDVEAGRPAARPPAGDVLRGDWGKPSGKRVTLEDTNSIDDTLQEIADAAGWNVSINTGRTGHKLLVLKLKNVPVEDALRATLHGTGLIATKTGEIVVVSPPDAELPDLAGPKPTLSGFEKSAGKFTGEFKATDVSDALRQIAKSAGFSILVPPGTHGKVNGIFSGVPVEDVLRAVLQQADLRAEKQGQLITVLPADGQFDFPIPPNFPPEAREALREARQAAREAAREASRSAREAARDAAREAREALRNAEIDPDDGRDRQVTGSDLTIAPGDRVRDVNVVRGNLEIQRGAVARDVSVVQGNADVRSGSVTRDVVTVLGNVRLEGGAVARQVVAVGGNVEVAAGASIENDVIAIGGRVQVDPEAQVGGSRKSFSVPGIGGVLNLVGPGLINHGSPSPLWAILQIIVKFVVLFLLGLVVLSLFPRRIEAVTGSMLQNPFKSVLAGLLGWLVMPVLTLLLVVTIVGIPLVAVQVLAIVAATVLGLTALVYYVGRTLPLPTQGGPAVAQLAIGVGIFAVVTEIPFLGAIVWISVLLFTFGAVLRTRFGQPREPLPTSPVPPAEGFGSP
ncbi:MAG: STN domain-containing protein [Anaeromyxobacteraceae bacterium]